MIYLDYIFMTPMLRQYFEIKEKNKDNILFFRLGDFYEMFGEDALQASSILDIALTARYKGTENEIPMCGIPHHAANQYIAKLTKAGRKVAICEQISDPKLPGIVKREVLRIITQGTTLDSSLLDKSENNFLASVFSGSDFGGGRDYFSGIAFLDLSTGDFKVMEIKGEENVLRELKRINPSEIIVDSLNQEKSIFQNFYNEKTRNLYWIFKNVSKFIPHNYFEPGEILCEQFEVKGLETFGIHEMRFGIRAAANLIMYLKDTQKNQLAHLKKISLHNPSDFMILDETTMRNLDLVQNSYSKGKEGTLLSVLERTITAMGARLLRQWILHPLIEEDKIKERLDKVENFIIANALREELQSIMKGILDIERIAARIGCARSNPRDLIGLKNGLCAALKLDDKKETLEAHARIECQKIIDLIDERIIEDSPVSIIDGGFIKSDVNAGLDELRMISSGGKDWITRLQAKERDRTGINSLKIKFNNIFGYYIEVSKANMDAVPSDYIRKQTLVNGERFVTPELKEYEDKVLSAEEKIKDLEYRIFNETVEMIMPFLKMIKEAAQKIAELDIILNFSQIASENNYVKPKFNREGIIELKDSRHPVIEKMPEVEFIANDIRLDNETQQLILITGPNMAGKSVYLRQTALNILMAQIGSYVPARSANLSIADRIFTRVGASDNIAYGQSTFMVEMQEAANILNNATEKSLIIFDELGRGTSTYDGVSIAWAVIEYIHNAIKAKTLFATHYHELSKLADLFDNIKNYRMAVIENEENVIFLHKVVKGGVDKSYGIEVAKLAGLPKDLIQRARQILSDLEKGCAIMNKSVDKNPPSECSVKLESEIEKKIKDMDLDKMTPMEVFNVIAKLKDKNN